MRKALDGIYRFFGGVAAALVAAILVVMIAGSIGRELGWRVSGANDLVSWLCAGASFFGMAYAFKQGDFVRVTLVLDRLAAGPRRLLEIVSLAIATVAVCYLAYWAARFTWESWEIHEIAGGLIAIPIWIPQTTFVFGSALLAVALIDEMVLVLRGAKPSYVTAVERRHAEGDFSADV